MKDGNKIYTIICPQADVDCMKGSCEVLKGTVIPDLSESINRATSEITNGIVWLLMTIMMKS